MRSARPAGSVLRARSRRPAYAFRTPFQLEQPGTVHGELSSSWTLDGDQFRLVTRIPDGVDAIVRLPDGSMERVVGGPHSYALTV